MKTPSIKTKQKWFTLSNLFTVLIALFTITMFISPKAKSAVLKSFMALGFFKPDSEAAPIEKTTVAPFDHVSFRDANGKTVSLAALKGKVVFINFWATWCPPCIAEMPSIQALYDKKKNSPDFVFLIVETDGNLKKALQFMEKNQYSLPTYTPNTPIPPEFLGSGIPTTVILDKRGQIAFKHEGMADYSHPDAETLLSNILTR